jgi:hypothetical protein
MDLKGISRHGKYLLLGKQDAGIRRQVLPNQGRKIVVLIGKDTNPIVNLSKFNMVGEHSPLLGGNTRYHLEPVVTLQVLERKFG